MTRKTYIIGFVFCLLVGSRMKNVSITPQKNMHSFSAKRERLRNKLTRGHTEKAVGVLLPIEEGEEEEEEEKDGMVSVHLTHRMSDLPLTYKQATLQDLALRTVEAQCAGIWSTVARFVFRYQCMWRCLDTYLRNAPNLAPTQEICLSLDGMDMWFVFWKALIRTMHESFFHGLPELDLTCCALRATGCGWRWLLVYRHLYTVYYDQIDTLMTDPNEFTRSSIKRVIRNNADKPELIYTKFATRHQHLMEWFTQMREDVMGCLSRAPKRVCILPWRKWPHIQHWQGDKNLAMTGVIMVKQEKKQHRLRHLTPSQKYNPDAQEQAFLFFAGQRTATVVIEKADPCHEVHVYWPVFHFHGEELLQVCIPNFDPANFAQFQESKMSD